MRLQKYLSAAGVCSRREAENRILAGRVTVNGRTAALGDGAEEGDTVAMDGKVITLPSSHTYIMLNKPRGYVTTLSDEKGRRTVAELVKDAGKRLYPVGRLDLDSEGLLLLTDDGAVAQALTHPSREIEKVYAVSVRGGDFQRAAAALETPLSDGDTLFSPAKAELLRVRDDRAELLVTIHEGKNREVRRMCALVGLEVLRLCRIRQGELLLGDLPSGKWRYLTDEELQYLHKIVE